MNLLSRLFFAEGVLLVAAATAEIQTQHAFDTSTKVKRFEILWHLCVRTQPEGGGLFQVRTGPIFEFDLSDRVTAIAGYYLTREQNESQWATIHRPFAGGEVMVWDRLVEVDWRSLLERFIVGHEPDYFRFRNRFRISPSRMGPSVWVDARPMFS